MDAVFFYKERKRTQRTPRSFIKNAKERKNVAFFWKERMPFPAYKQTHHRNGTRDCCYSMNYMIQEIMSHSSNNPLNFNTYSSVNILYCMNCMLYSLENNRFLVLSFKIMYEAQA